VVRRWLAPPVTALLWRLVGVAVTGARWLSSPGTEAGLALVLVLAILGLARWRFHLPAWTTLVDQAACAAVAPFWPPAVLGLVLPAFDACLEARPAYALPVLAILVAFRSASVPVVTALAAAALAGAATGAWDRQLAGARREADRDRRERWDLESLRSELLSANVRVARMAETAERARIARDLHDHAGHEITAAGLALDAYRGLRDEGDPQADELLAEARRRVADGMEILRRTARGMAPEAVLGAGALEEICRRFSAAPVAFAVHGDASAVPVHAWSVLEPGLKEGLTNAVRHGTSRQVRVSLDVGPGIVRLDVHASAGEPEPGQVRTPPPGGRGLGLRSLSQRAEAVGGSVTVDARDGFRLVCVLPLPGPAPTAGPSPAGAGGGGPA
jgi:signal transduction histidine kinase